ncbi:MAG TPA: prepilin-type N-terminal cleavage/methylation domain-containing protein [Solirubrobacterales bacterium]|jgi:type II secretory pathway pseudopilin PulG
MRRPVDSEAGFTIVEVLVAVVILVVGALTTFSLLSAATRNTQRAKASQVALDLAQQELEALHSLSNKELALKTRPGHVADQLDPDHRVNASLGTFATSREPLGSFRKLVVNGDPIEGESGKYVEGGVVKRSEVFEIGDVSGTIHRYVVWRNDEACGAACPTSQDFKQIIVAVKLDTPGNQAAERGYVEAQSNFVDPVDSAAKDPAPNSEGNLVTAQQFFLSDTPCAASGETERQEITGDHLLHNTLGKCSDGVQNGETPGAPDALLLGGPPDPTPDDTSTPGLYDYATDTYLEPAPDTDKGVQIRVDNTSGCHYKPTNPTNAEARVHRWVTDPMETTFKMTGKVTLEFYTRTLNDNQRSAELCVFLFMRDDAKSPPDTQLKNKNGNTEYWYYAPTLEGNTYWPRNGPINGWTKVRLTMNFNEVPYTILAGDRLGVGLSLERQATNAEAIPIMYDHPTYPSRIEVDTSTPIEGG